MHCGGCVHGEDFRSPDGVNSHIRILFTSGDPADYLGPDRLLVAQYAWDGNRFAAYFLDPVVALVAFLGIAAAG